MSKIDLAHADAVLREYCRPNCVVNAQDVRSSHATYQRAVQNLVDDNLRLCEANKKLLKKLKNTMGITSE